MYPLCQQYPGRGGCNAIGFLQHYMWLIQHFASCWGLGSYLVKGHLQPAWPIIIFNVSSPYLECHQRHKSTWVKIFMDILMTDKMCLIETRRAVLLIHIINPFIFSWAYIVLAPILGIFNPIHLSTQSLACKLTCAPSTSLTRLPEKAQKPFERPRAWSQVSWRGDMDGMKTTACAIAVLKNRCKTSVSFNYASVQYFIDTLHFINALRVG